MIYGFKSLAGVQEITTSTFSLHSCSFPRDMRSDVRLQLPDPVTRRLVVMTRASLSTQVWHKSIPTNLKNLIPDKMYNLMLRFQHFSPVYYGTEESGKN